MNPADSNHDLVFSDAFRERIYRDKWACWAMNLSETDFVDKVRSAAPLHRLVQAYRAREGRPLEITINSLNVAGDPLERLNLALRDVELPLGNGPAGPFVTAIRTWPRGAEIGRRLREAEDTAWVAEADDNQISRLLNGLANLVIRMRMVRRHFPTDSLLGGQEEWEAPLSDALEKAMVGKMQSLRLRE